MAAGRTRAVLGDLPNGAFGYPDPTGSPTFRRSVATWLSRTRGMSVAPEEVIVVAGVAQALALLARVLLADGVDRIAVEDPGSRGARMQLGTWGMAHPAGPGRRRAACGSTSCGETGVPAVLLTPAHQFPTGVVLDGTRRRELLRWAIDGGLIIEDDYDAEHRYDRPPTPALQSMLPEHVCYTGSVSKLLAPALRVGWLVAPPRYRREPWWPRSGNPISAMPYSPSWCWAGCASAEGLRRAGHISDVLGCSITLADIRITQGRLTDALLTYQDALLLAGDDSAPTRGTADMHVGISQIACERNDLAAASSHLQLSRELGDAAGLPQNPYRRRVAQARLLAAQGNLPDAIVLLDEAERVYFGDFAPNVRPIAALRTRFQLACGDLPTAVSWARAQNLPDGQPTYLHEFEHLTVAMVLLAQHRAGRSPAAAHEAARLLERLLAAAQAGGRHGTCIEILVQLAVAAHAVGDRSLAGDLLGRALVLAEREGHIRVFLDAGPSLGAMLRTVEPHRPGGRHGRAVLAASVDKATSDAPAAGPATPRQPLLDPLSTRELDVLRLLASDLSGPAIARELSVSVNTVRTHTRHIYAKLGVANRREAVRKAVRLGLQRYTGH